MGRHSAAGVMSAMRSDRRVHLDALRGAVQARPELACGIVERRGVTWVRVVRVGSRRMVEVGCDYMRSGWWFTWADGRLIGPVWDVERVVGVLVRELADA